MTITGGGAQRRISQSIVGDDYGSEEGEASDSEEEDYLAQVSY